MSLYQYPHRFELNHPHESSTTNRICTSKYTWLSFLPLNLYEQLSRPINLFFLLISALQTVPDVSITGGLPLTMIPLSFVIAVTAVKDLLEDFKRQRSDLKENSAKVLVWGEGGFQTRTWGELKPGHVISLKDGDAFPADCLLLYTRDGAGVAYVETKALDGETNLKRKLAVWSSDKHLNELPKELSGARVIAEGASADLQNFSGKWILAGEQQGVSIGMSNVLLRATSLRNTGQAVGVVLYAGHETRIMQNSVKAKSKRSSLDKEVDRCFVLVAAAELALVLLAAGFHVVYLYIHRRSFEAWLDYRDFTAGGQFLRRLGSWVIIFGLAQQKLHSDLSSDVNGNDQAFPGRLHRQRPEAGQLAGLCANIGAQRRTGPGGSHFV